METLEHQLGFNFEQSDELRELILNAASRYGKAMFFAGFKLAARTQLE